MMENWLMAKSDAPPIDDALVHEVLDILRELLHRLLMSSVPVWIDLQLTLPQLRTVFAIAHNEVSSVMQIAGYLGIGKSTASHLIERLVRAGLVDRSEDPEDRRRATIRLTAEGDQLIERLLGWEELLGGWLSKVPQKDLSSFRHGLNELMTTLQAQTKNDNSASDKGW
jgi:MarR family transcriptional regulator, organic hydroperoxide resistance regulator